MPHTAIICSMASDPFVTAACAASLCYVWPHRQAYTSHTPRSALKTKGNTPKYGLIFHSSFIGRAKQRNKGRISRYLANKCSIASRIDCFSDAATNVFGEKMREQVSSLSHTRSLSPTPLLLLCLSPLTLGLPVPLPGGGAAAVLRGGRRASQEHGCDERGHAGGLRALGGRLALLYCYGCSPSLDSADGLLDGRRCWLVARRL